MAEVGRPSTYDPAYCERVVQLGKEGKSKTEIASALETCRASLDRWAEEHEEFRTAITRAKVEEQAWWEKVGREALYADKFQPAVWKKSMEARFRDDYTERRELGGTDGGPIKVMISQDDDAL